MTPQSAEDFTRDATHRATHRLTRLVMFGIFATAAFFLFGEFVHLLWNWLMPALFHLSSITYWQGLGVIALSWILFGGLRGHRGRCGHGHSHSDPWRRRMQERMRERWQQMTPEEREKFHEWIRGQDAQAKA
ncbi:MAG TPA: hypothetical protein VGR81_09625 [Candidatus Acidoferrales bacterium]|nr:hypothetical protein [Candidatus Acidoferrales bacterium]